MSIRHKKRNCREHGTICRTLKIQLGSGEFRPVHHFLSLDCLNSLNLLIAYGRAHPSLQLSFEPRRYRKLTSRRSYDFVWVQEIRKEDGFRFSTSYRISSTTCSWYSPRSLFAGQMASLVRVARFDPQRKPIDGVFEAGFT
jgi:hypothetical protein